MSEPFDFEAFIAGTQLARRKVSFYRADHRDEIGRLTAEHDALPEAGADERESSKSGRRKLADRIASLRVEMAASETHIVVRTLTPEEYEWTAKDDVTTFDQFAKQTVEPELTPDQVARLAASVGVAQWSVMLAEANMLVASKVAVPDFSQSVSKTLSPPESSQS